MSEMVTCPACKGKGYTLMLGWPLLQKSSCWKCGGRGKLLVYTYQEVDRIFRQSRPEVENPCPYEHGTVCTFDVLKLSDCQNPKKCKPRDAEKDSQNRVFGEKSQEEPR